jgi:predicted  nucleic acid-binding Zn-ribbon protein
MDRVEKLVKEKTELLERLSAKKREGANASEAAKKLRAEVFSLRQKLKRATETISNADSNADSNDDSNVLRARLRRAERQTFTLKMRSESEMSRLYAQVHDLRGVLASREADLESARKELATVSTFADAQEERARGLI